MIQHFVFVGVMSLAVLVACQTSPTGRSQFVAMPESQVDSMGVQAFEEMKQKIPIDRDPRDNAYVKCIANAITAVLDSDQPKQWEVVVFEDKSANAFALPGSKIGVHTGILPVANTASQLAAVIGHEIGHVIAQHGRERVSQQLAVQGLVFSAGMFANRDSKMFQIGMAALGLGAQFGVLLPFGRAQESEADVIGLDLMAKAGFDPRESVQLWQNMAKANGGAQPPQWMSTHPSNETRMETLSSRMNDALRTQAASGRRPNCVR